MDQPNQKKLEEIAQAHDTHQDFDGVLAHYTGVLIAPQVKGKKTLECGCSTGVMTPMLLEHTAQLDIVEGSEVYAKITESKYSGKVKMFVSLFEDFNPADKYEAIVFAGVLHHIANPVEILKKVSTWIQPGGDIYITVPNMTAFHRRLGVAMELNESVYDTSVRNDFFAQPGRFDRERLQKVIQEAGYTIIDSKGFFFKPFPHDIMNKMNWDSKLLDGLFRMGMEFPDLACQLYVKAQWNPTQN